MPMELIVDTNLFLECRRLEDLPWSDVLEDDNITLLVVDPVVGELDEKKDASQTRVRKAARKALERLDAIEAREELIIRDASPRVVMRYESTEAKRHAALDLTRPDHRIVGIAAQLVDTSDRRVAVFSGDRGPRLKARALQVTAIAIPTEWRRTDPLTEEEKKLAEVTRENERLRRQEPELRIQRIQPEEGDAVLEVPIYQALTAAEVDTLMSEVMELHPIETVFDHSRRGMDRSLARIIMPMSHWRSVSDEKIEVYRSDYSDWLEEVRNRLENLHDVIGSRNPVLEVNFEIENIGTRPAEDLLVTISGKGKIEIVPFEAPNESEGDEGLDSLFPSPPNAPQGKWVQTSVLGLNRGFSSALNYGLTPNFLHTPSLPVDKDDDAFYYRDRRPSNPVKEYSLTCKLYRHGEGGISFSSLVTPEQQPSLNQEISGAVEISLNASNLSNSERCCVPVRICGVAGDIVKAARREIDEIQAANLN